MTFECKLSELHMLGSEFWIFGSHYDAHTKFQYGAENELPFKMCPQEKQSFSSMVRYKTGLSTLTIVI